jgi:transcriptional regulator with XRE-family HTH domain
VRKKVLNDNLDIRIGDNLRRVREFNKLTQTEVGYILNVSPQQIAKYETGRNRISASNLYRLASYYNTNMNKFLLITDKELEMEVR